MTTAPHPSADRRKLNSWKEIADYLQRDVRTVVRWEQEKRLPVHRGGGVGRQSVFAFTDEIDAWLKEPAPMAAYAAEPAANKKSGNIKWIIAAGALLVLGALATTVWMRIRPPAPEPARAPMPVPSALRFSWPKGAVEFQPRRIDLGATTAASTIAADFNRDGLPDLAAVQALDSSVSVMLGRGDGTFAPPTVYPACNTATYTGTAADLDADGAVDLVLACHESRRVRVLWGSAERAFQDYTDLPSDTGPRGLDVADLNGDGTLDVVAGNMLRGTASVFLNRGARKFAARSFPLLAGVCQITVHDVDGDGKPDVVATSTNTIPMALLKGRGDGSFGAPQNITSFRAGWLHLVVDLDGDNSPEIVTSDAEGEVLVMGGGGFTNVRRLGVKVGGWYAMLAADFNRDGKPDVLGSLAWQNSLLMLAGDANGLLIPAEFRVIGRYPSLGAIADFNRDGLPDAVFPLGQEPALMVLIQKPAN